MTFMPRENGPVRSSDNLLKQGEAFFSQGRLEEAENCFLTSLRIHPLDPDCLNNLGAVAYARGTLEAAEKMFVQALRLDGDHVDALSNLADLYEGAGRWEEAAQRLGMLVLSRNENQELHDRLAKASAEAGKDARLSGNLRASFLEENITPGISEANPALLQGMAGPPRRAAQVLSPLMMQILLLEDHNFTKVLFVTADLFGFGSEMVERIRSAAAPWGIPPEAIVLNASHTHYAPGTVSHVVSSLGPFYREYADALCSSVEKAMPVLYDRLETCDVSSGAVEAQIGVNRRVKSDERVLFAPNPSGDVDRYTPFLHLRLRGSRKSVLMLSHACHPTGLGGDCRISSDFPGVLRTAIVQTGLANCVMFLQGAAGTTKESVPSAETPKFCVRPEDVEKNGSLLAEKICQAMASELCPERGPVFCTIDRAALPLRRYGTLSPAGFLAGPDGHPALPTLADAAVAPYEASCNKEAPRDLSMEVQLISIGRGVRFFTFPAETTAELSLKLRRGMPEGGVTFVLGYTNGLLGYLPTDDMIEEGGYEPDTSSAYYLLPAPLDTGTESAVMDAVRVCIDRNEQVDRAVGYGRYHKVSGKGRAFFVLSSGRCGTMTLTHLLATSGNARVWHHPMPYLINETLLAYWDAINKSHVFWRARGPLIRKAWAEGLVHGETDHNMTPFADVIGKEIPEAKFIVLVRDPRDFVRSGMRRNYYQGHPWDLGRLRPAAGTPEFARWERMSRFEKVCWLWSATYERIFRLMDVLGKERTMLVRFEDLTNGPVEARRIFDFLELDGFGEEKILEVLSQRLNAQEEGQFPRPEAWSSEMHGTLMQQCALLAEKFGYCLKDPDKRKARTSPPPLNRVGERPAGRGEPTVSVGLPVFNGGALLSEAIESILDQDFGDLELLLSDNGSTDNTREVCERYRRADRRVRYCRFDENLGAIRNFQRALDACGGTYFMWASHDDLRETSFISRCLEVLERNPGAALVYPRTKVVDRSGGGIGLAEDAVHADQETPSERFRHLIHHLGMCNCFYGLYRAHAVRRARSLRKHLYRAYDNLFLAEIALLGKILRIEDPLFTRRLTRNYNRTIQDYNADLISTIDPVKLREGITLPFCRLTYAHLELVNESDLPSAEKEALLIETLTCFKNRFGRQMRFEIDRAVRLVETGTFFATWDDSAGANGLGPSRILSSLHVSNLLKGLQEAMFIHPEDPGLRRIYPVCLSEALRNRSAGEGHLAGCLKDARSALGPFRTA